MIMLLRFWPGLRDGTRSNHDSYGPSLGSESRGSRLVPAGGPNVCWGYGETNWGVATVPCCWQPLIMRPGKLDGLKGEEDEKGKVGEGVSA
jgi:hypothetical protein